MNTVRDAAQLTTEAATGFGLIGASAMVFRGDHIGVLLFVQLTVCMIVLRAHPQIRGERI
jgi:hypothetical protein